MPNPPENSPEAHTRPHYYQVETPSQLFGGTGFFLDYPAFTLLAAEYMQRDLAKRGIAAKIVDITDSVEPTSPEDGAVRMAYTPDGSVTILSLFTMDQANAQMKKTDPSRKTA